MDDLVKTRTLYLYTNFVYNMLTEKTPKVRKMNTKTVNISFRKDLLEKIDKVAKEEMRNRSELIREASRLYIERKERWEKIFDFGTQQAERLGLKEQDIAEEIQKFRQKNR